MGPSPDQIEVALFGPGYGECALVHLGAEHWVVVDSCIDSHSGEPAALSYLRGLGVEPAHAVKLIVATHWHDDHVRGLSRVLDACHEAPLCCASALGHREFLAAVLPYEQRNLVAGGSGVREIAEVWRILERRDGGMRHPRKAIANRLVYEMPAPISAHGSACRVWTLSPSDAQVEKFWFELTRLMPGVKETKRRALAQAPNHLSVVVWLEVGATSILLGGDLQDSADAARGWSAIVASAEKPTGRASIFKLPHHGDGKAHHPGVWDHMLTEVPYAILTPFCRSGLPSAQDLARIRSLTERGYASAKCGTRSPAPKRSAAVEKTIRETVGKLRPAQPSTGLIRLRNGGRQNPHVWDVELRHGAYRL